MTKPSRRRLWCGSVGAAVLVALGAGAVWAQGAPPAATPAPATPPAASPPPAPPAAPAPAAAAEPAADPVVAKVNGHDIHLSDVAAAAHGLPPQAQQMPPNVLYPMIIDQLIDRQALVTEARKEGLQNDPDVKREV
jgi:peptidyl-prolyl cis-trans isomerase C